MPAQSWQCPRPNEKSWKKYWKPAGVRHLLECSLRMPSKSWAHMLHAIYYTNTRLDYTILSYPILYYTILYYAILSGPICYMLYAIMLHKIHYMLYSIWYMVYGIWYLVYGICCMRRASIEDHRYPFAGQPNPKAGHARMHARVCASRVDTC